MKFYLENYGCKLNEADSEIIKGLLSENHEEVFDFSLADFIILNTCGVIDKTEKKIIERTLFLKNKGKKVFWTGCLPLITKNNVSDGSIGPNNLSDINKMIKEENHFFNNVKEDKSLLCKYKKRKEGISATVAISEG
ncbi:MAG: threonylcarbamoyladenosine tRNA methylthiotransferase, partial [Candidatus Pacebacteria bacterium]|nr:threonylcarbamoyladenosine tRNA methylthiotransferase [Candidatus Paceibacterota bacterium]